MAQEITIMIDSVNIAKLHEELYAALGDVVAGVSTAVDRTFVVVEDGVDVDVQQIQAIADAHDSTALTDEQQALAVAATAPQRARAVPGWARWDEAQAVNYIDSNVTDLASAKTVLKAMARLLVAQRDALWPGLGIE